MVHIEKQLMSENKKKGAKKCVDNLWIFFFENLKNHHENIIYKK
jgi:hypothetical protein